MSTTTYYTIAEQKKVARDAYCMQLSGDTRVFTRPGQFINIAIDGLYLRRPISVCDWDETGLTIVYKVVGAGTRRMADMPAGTVLDVLAGLGNGFDTETGCRHALLIGGGVGTPPLYGLAKQLLRQGTQVTVALGFNTADEAMLVREFAVLGANVRIATLDGSLGQTGYPTDLLTDADDFDYYYSCGPEPMLRAVHGKLQIPGQLSFEERMACGFGACMGCSCATKYGYKRICSDGPVLKSSEVVW